MINLSKQEYVKQNSKEYKWAPEMLKKRGIGEIM